MESTAATHCLPEPEWPGASSYKFADPKHGSYASRQIVPTMCRNGPEHGLARNGFGAYSNDSRGLEITEGKRTFAQRPPVHMEWRPAQRYIEAPGRQKRDDVTGVRIVEQPLRDIRRVPEKRHLRQVSSKEEAGDRPQGPQTVYRENGLRAVDQPAQEVDISKEFNRRVRVPDMTAQRNGVQCRSLGDKSYRHPDYERNFHQIGGLVVGSTFLRGDHKKTESKNKTNVIIAQENLDRTQGKSWEEWKHDQREERRREHLAGEVAELTLNWEASTLKHYDATSADLDSDDEEEVTLVPQEDGKK